MAADVRQQPLAVQPEPAGRAARYLFQAAGSCGGVPVSSRVRRSPSMSATAMSETGPQGSLPPGLPSVGTL